MRTYPSPTNKDDQEYLQNLNAKPWQIELLRANPTYVHWGCYEDYMSVEGERWTSRIIIPTWKQYVQEWGLNELNELVNFYFQVYRKGHQCEHCDGSAYNPATKELADTWYNHDRVMDGRKRWCDKITDIEVAALMRSGRISDVSGFHGHFDEENQTWVEFVGDFPNKKKVNCEQPPFPSAESVNEWQRSGHVLDGHDAINKAICVHARAEHLGVYGLCEHCYDGFKYDEPEAKVGLQLWFIHPRKGASRGVYIEEVLQTDLEAVLNHLREARERNHERFEKINTIDVAASMTAE